MRPCSCDRAAAGVPYSLDQCRRCWRWKNDPAFRRAVTAFGKARGPAAGRRPAARPRPPARVPLPVRPPCAHLGAVEDRDDRTGKPCLCAGKWLHRCDVFGVCTRVEARPGVADCLTCPEYLRPEDDRP